MKRFHVHLVVGDLAGSVAFYSAVFGEAPSVLKPDYAKWMLEEPRVNFALSTGAARAGVDHLGLQADTEDELGVLRERARSADLELREEPNTVCCYARSDKFWMADPQGIAWETFHTREDASVYAEGGGRSAAVCCGPGAAIAAEKRSPCCG